jgi:hypothetical protein
MSNKIQERLSSYRVYLDGVDLLGMADVDLPDIEAMTDTVKGAGIAGEIDTPVVGHYSSMSMTLNWRTVSGNLMLLATPVAHHLELRGAVQIYDAASGTYSTQAQKIVVKANPKKIGLGKMDTGATQDSSSEFEVSYIKVSIGGISRLEIDKFNFICVINGIDFLAETREALGLGM